MRLTFVVDEPLLRTIDAIKKDRHTTNTSQIVREALWEYSFFLHNKSTKVNYKSSKKETNHDN